MIDVELLNPEVVENLYRNHGLFACVCYATPDSRSEKVGRKCQESGHMSGSRCEYIKFRISGIDRGTAEQCLRHEIGTAVPLAMQDNYSISDEMDLHTTLSPDQVVKNMASFRYIDKAGFKWVTPLAIEYCPEAKAEYDALMLHINEKRRAIKAALERSGIASVQATEDANFVLPRATTTDLIIAFTPEALIHFCHKRMCSRAQQFIREIAWQMREAVAVYSPEFADELKPQCEHYLWCPEKERSCGRFPLKRELQALLEYETQVGK